MRKTFWHQIILISALLGFTVNAFAIPAPRKITTMAQPDGTILHVWLKGDEFFHYIQSTDGYLLLADRNGFYTYAEHDSTGRLQAGSRIARDVDKRTDSDRVFLKSIKPGLSFSNTQMGAVFEKRMLRGSANKSALRSTKALAPELINNYPTTGSPKSLVILVNFSDKSFNPGNTTSGFSNMLNQEGYEEGYHVGSSRDYYRYNSGGLFTPDFVVVGPVTLPNTMAYYGHNDGDGYDLNPEQMVKEACELINGEVDFAEFDLDNDHIVDNVYVFYAGMGEADGGNENTIWPHSYSVSKKYPNLILDGMKIDAYACSGELNGSGNRSGIGTFTHEYAHILGLPDM
ncbi:MAG: M6 family metalloprotease domain-containing protein, partial [Bacteroidales bacterium]|nr:M6 family metalloprotease domain-containing protein [Bacteroidales bacterium]